MLHEPGLPVPPDGPRLEGNAPAAAWEMAMPFEFDPPDNIDLTSQGLEKIDTTEEARDR